jgi:hypothetical protein
MVGSLVPLNDVRARHRACMRASTTSPFLDTQNDASSPTPSATATTLLIVVVNLDPHNAQEGAVVVPATWACRPSSTPAT